MRTPGSLFGFLLVALLAGSLAGQAQTAPAYRPPAATAAPSQSMSSSSAAPSQCAGAAGPAGATLVTRGSGNVPAPKSGQPAYAQVPLNLANYSVGGLLTVQITVGNGANAASFELFAAGTTFPANGVPSSQPLASNSNVSPGRCATLNYNFSQAGSFILAATGATGSNTFQYAAYVQPSFTGVFLAPATQPTTQPAQPATPDQPATSQANQPSQPTPSAPPAPTPNNPLQGPGMFDGVFSPNPGPQPTQPAQAASPQPVQQTTSPASQAPAATQPSTPALLSNNPPLEPGQSTIVSTGPNPAPPQPTAPAPPGPVLIRSVTIKNSPGVPDTGAHCIICGFFQGNFKAVEPNPSVCLTPAAAAVPTGSHGSCTPTCESTHDCTQAFPPPGVMINATNRTVHVVVWDDDGNGHLQQLSAFDESDISVCNTGNPCPVNNPDGGQMLVSFEVATCGLPTAAASGHPQTFIGSNTPKSRDVTTDNPGNNPLADPGKSLSATASSLASGIFSLEPAFTNTAQGGLLTYTPTDATTVHYSPIVEVQTGMIGVQGNQKCTDYPRYKQSCNGITLHASNNVPNARFVQYYYRQNGTADHCPDPWCADAAYPPSPYYNPQDVITDCNGSTMYDSPTFENQTHEIFHGKDFVISNGTIVAAVDWTLDHPIDGSVPLDYGGRYTVSITPYNPPLTTMPAPFGQMQTLAKEPVYNPLSPNAAP